MELLDVMLCENQQFRKRYSPVILGSSFTNECTSVVEVVYIRRTITQQIHAVYTKSHKRCIDVDATLSQHCVPAGRHALSKILRRSQMRDKCFSTNKQVQFYFKLGVKP